MPLRIILAISTAVVQSISLWIYINPKAPAPHTPSPDAKEAQLRFQVWPKGVDASDLQKHRGLVEKPWCCVAPWAWSVEKLLY